MEQASTTDLILEMIEQPAFCVRDGVIIHANNAARQSKIIPGTPINQLLTDDLEAYQGFQQGSMAVTLHLASTTCTASVIHGSEYDIFRIEQDPVNAELKALALVAQHIRVPLASAMTVCDDIVSRDEHDRQMAQLNKSLYQLHRLICNLSDTARYYGNHAMQMQVVNLTALFKEVFDKAAAALANAEVNLKYCGPDMPIFGVADEETLRRAVYNILSNSAKFSPKGSTIQAKLARTGNMLHFTVQDEGTGIPTEVLSNVFSRFLRSPSIEDGRNGIGLGIPLIHAVAAAHGGTVLIDHPDQGGTRITMTIQIKTDSTEVLRTPTIKIGDYAGGRDLALLEFSKILPPETYDNRI